MGKMNLKKIGLIVVGVVVFLIVVTIGLNWWINVKLPQLISEKNETPYHIQYKKLEISLFSKTIEASGITIAPKQRAQDSLSKNGIFASVENLKMDHFALVPLLFGNKIEASSITVSGAKITLFKNNDQAVTSAQNIGSYVVAPFQKIIKVENVYLEKGSFFIVNLKNNKTLFAAQNVSVQLDDIAISEQTLVQKIPFDYKKYAINCDSLFYLTADGYRIQIAQIQTTNTGINLKRFSMVPQLSRREFVNQLPKEKDVFELKAEKMEVKDMDWGFNAGVLFFKTSKISINQADALIYRSKIPKDDLSIKPLYNKLLRELPFELKVDTLAIVDSKLVYEEEKSFDKGAGRLEFTDFNMAATHLTSGFKKTKRSDVVITIDCKFMNRSPMRIDWRFNVMDKKDSFTIKGRILNFETGTLAVFTKPYLNATTTGTFDQVYFNFSGNDDFASGDFALKFSGLKVQLYQKKNLEKVSKLKSWIGNLLLKDDSDGELLEREVTVERIKEKSFYNYFWLCIAEGIKKTVL
jgi:hypothetical protein